MCGYRAWVRGVAGLWVRLCEPEAAEWESGAGDSQREGDTGPRDCG